MGAMRVQARTALLLGLGPLVFGCGLVDDCSYEERHVTGFNAVIENGELILRAEIVIDELRGSLEWKSLNASISGTLKGHVTSILLTSSTDPSAQFAIRSTRRPHRSSRIAASCKGPVMSRPSSQDCTR